MVDATLLGHIKQNMKQLPGLNSFLMFFEDIKQGKSLPTRGEKRTSMYHHQLEQQLHDLNQNAQSEKRHFVENTQQPKCHFSQTAVHTYHAVKFAQKLCPNLTSHVDKKGSATRAQKLSQTRTAVLQQFIDQHNLTAVSKKAAFHPINPTTKM